MTAGAAKRIKVVLVEDSEVVRMGLAALLGTAPRLQIVGEAGSVAVGIERAAFLLVELPNLDRGKSAVVDTSIIK